MQCCCEARSICTDGPAEIRNEPKGWGNPAPITKFFENELAQTAPQPGYCVCQTLRQENYSDVRLLGEINVGTIVYDRSTKRAVPPVT